MARTAGRFDARANYRIGKDHLGGLSRRGGESRQTKDTAVQLPGSYPQHPDSHCLGF